MARTRSSRVGNFLHTALLLECVERSGDLARRQQFDGRFQSRVLLANDLIESGGAHSGFLQLLEGAARFDALMLADIADQKHAVIGTKPRKELAHLVGAGKARFIDKVEVLLLCVGLDLQCGRGSLAGFRLQFLPHSVGARRGRSGRNPQPDSPAFPRRCG